MLEEESVEETRRRLPTFATPKIEKTINSGEDFFTEDEISLREELPKSAKVYKSATAATEDTIKEMIDIRFRELKEKYPRGGWKSLQLITADMLFKMPEDWMNRYTKDVQEATRWTQQQLAERERSDEIAAAQNNPTSDKYIDSAFRSIQAILTEFLDRKSYRNTDRFLMMSLVASEIIGLSVIDPLWRDRRIDEIIINGPEDIQVEMYGQLRRVPSVKFRDAAHVLSFLERIFSSINKNLSPKTPLLKGRLHDQSRIFAVHPYVAPEGPNVAIRRHPDKYWTVKDLVEKDAFSEEIGTWLGNMVYKGCSFLVLGGTSTGKTSFLNAMTGLYRDDVRLITLEDNLEMRPHPGKMIAAAMETKPGSTENPEDGVSMRDLVKATLQMRPDGLIVGEVTDGAAYDLAQALNTGHFGASTVHANSEFDGIYRLASLIQQGASLDQDQTLPLIAAAFDFVILLERFPEDGSRRVVSISEVDPYVTNEPGKSASLGVKQLFRFVPDDKEFDAKGQLIRILGHWEKTAEFSEIRSSRHHLDLVEDLSWEEILKLSEIPENETEDLDELESV